MKGVNTKNVVTFCFLVVMPILVLCLALFDSRSAGWLWSVTWSAGGAAAIFELAVFFGSKKMSDQMADSLVAAMTLFFALFYVCLTFIGLNKGGWQGWLAFGLSIALAVFFFLGFIIIAQEIVERRRGTRLMRLKKAPS